MSLAELRRKKLNVETIVKEMNKDNNSYSKNDERIWTLTTDKSGIGYAVIRFLPPVAEEDIPWVRLYNHGFQHNSKWLIENCPTTIGLDCPVCTANRELWNDGTEKSKSLASNRKRKTSYYSNILVIKDPADPTNEGKVFIYRYGTKIYEKIKAQIEPKFQDDVPLNPFDIDTGANFRLRASRVEGYLNYDESKFDSSTKISEDDAEVEKIYNQCYPLATFIAPSEFKTYSELETLLDRVLNSGGKPAAAVALAREEKAAAVEVGASKRTDTVTDDDDDSSAVDYFNKIANDV